MNTIQAIAKREDVSPKEGKSKYGDVKFADEKNKKYPLDSETHVRAAWSYINMPKNAAKYSPADVKTIKSRIKAAGKKYGIEFSDDGDKSESSIVTAASTHAFDGNAPSQIVFMPKGNWTITPKVNGESKEVTVTVDEQTATALQSDLEQRLQKPVRPIGGFDHRPGPASFLPKSFTWDAAQGVVLNVDWTKAGKEAIEGRDYSYFSPTFLLKDGKVKGLTSRGEIGSLTNHPAFEEITRIAASADPDNDPDPDDDVTQGTNMKIATKLVELELITAEQAEDEEAISAAIDHLSSVLTTTQASNAALLTENTALKAEAERVKGSEADSVIQAAIAEGKIGAQDKDTIGFYRAQLIAQPVTAKKVIAAMPVNPVLKKVIEVKAGDSRSNLMAEGKTKAKLIADQHNIVNEIMAANPKMTYSDAFNKAKREHGELFIEAV